MSWACFLATPTDRAVQSLRRYVTADCPAARGRGYHNAEILLEEITLPADGLNGSSDDNWPHDDPRWPATCACGYRFTDADQWQYNYHRLYVAPDGRTFPLVPRDETPVGAMWYADWMLHEEGTRPTDAELAAAPPGYTWWLSKFYYQQHWGKRPPLTVRLPDGSDWCMDAIATNGDGWQVTGDPPQVTAAPSIKSPGYHGFLQHGVLTDDLEGHTY